MKSSRELIFLILSLIEKKVEVNLVVLKKVIERGLGIWKKTIN